MVAAVKKDELNAMARGSLSGGTRKASSEELEGPAKARAAPNSTSTQ
jgi:hypothetical protein